MGLKNHQIFRFVPHYEGPGDNPLVAWNFPPMFHGVGESLLPDSPRVHLDGKQYGEDYRAVGPSEFGIAQVQPSKDSSGTF